MASNKKPTTTRFHYNRKKNSLEINGSPSDVKNIVMLDMIFTKLKFIAIFMVVLIAVPKASLVSTLLKFIKDKIF